MLAEPRGFCAGVEKAIKALAWMVRVFEPPVYCYHEIVHNRHVVERFRDQGVVFVDDVADVPAGAPLMLSAHGSAPEVVEAARARGGVVVDAVCPLVTKVHHELKVRSRKGYTVLYVGHAGHEEAVGTMAVAPESVRLLEHEEDLDALEDLAAEGTPVALLAQTTLSHDEWRGLMEAARRRFPDLWMPNRSDLCFATTNRQAALKAIASKSDAVVVIGSANSSNTVALEKVARAGGLPPGAAGQRGRRAARRPVRHGRRDGRRLGTRGPGRGGHRPPGPRRGRDRGDRDHRGRVLPTSTRAPGAPAGRGLHAGLPGRPPGSGPGRSGGRGPCRLRRRRPRPAGLVRPVRRDDWPMTFTRMDESTAEQWQHIIVESIEHQPRVADRVLAMLASLEEITDGFEVDQLVHSLQTATRAEEAGASDEVVVASLCHDIGKAVSVMNHPRIAAEILRPYVSDDTYHMIQAHQDFQGRHYYEYLGQDPNARDKYEGEPWYGLAEQFADEWDQISFDPDYPTKPLSHFEPLVRQVFATPRSL